MNDNGNSSISGLIQFRSFILLCLMISVVGYPQVSPYSLTPDWYFGQGGRLTFATGSYPTSGAPTVLYKGTNTSTSVENSTSISFSDGSVALYSNTMQAYNNNPANTTWNDFVRNFTTDVKCAGSSTGGAVAFPDPASPNNAFYIILANDVTGGGCANQGITRYRFTGTGINVVYDAGPTTITPNSFAGEALAVGTDSAGGYFVVAHDKGVANTFRVWRYTPSGTTGPIDYTVGANVTDVSASQSYLKISPCQDKIAYHSGGILVVHEFDRKTGAIGNELRRISPANFGAGLEFSPDGGTIYYSGQGNIVSYVNIATGIGGTISGSASWSMQLGPDGKIYTSPGGTSVGVIANPNGGAGTYSTMALPGSGSIYRGLINLAWLTPEKPSINNTINVCDVNFAHDFKNYFLSNIGVNAGSFSWNFGDGQTSTTISPTHTYAANGSYNVTLSFRDGTCGHRWSATKTVNISCIAPVSWIDFDVRIKNNQVLLEWTVIEDENNQQYEIQGSNDGVNFETLGIVKPSAAKGTLSSYSFEYQATSSQKKYFRISQLDKDGTVSSSKIQELNLVSPQILVYPNPSNHSFCIFLKDIMHGSITIYNLQGVMVLHKDVNEGTESIEFGQDLPSGTYFIKNYNETDHKVIKIIKQ